MISWRETAFFKLLNCVDLVAFKSLAVAFYLLVCKHRRMTRTSQSPGKSGTGASKVGGGRAARKRLVLGDSQLSSPAKKSNVSSGSSGRSGPIDSNPTVQLERVKGRHADSFFNLTTFPVRLLI